jgi:hypothetical protein
MILGRQGRPAQGKQVHLLILKGRPYEIKKPPVLDYGRLFRAKISLRGRITDGWSPSCGNPLRADVMQYGQVARLPLRFLHECAADGYVVFQRKVARQFR